MMKCKSDPSIDKRFRMQLFFVLINKIIIQKVAKEPVPRRISRWIRCKKSKPKLFGEVFEEVFKNACTGLYVWQIIKKYNWVLNTKINNCNGSFYH